MEKEMKYKIGEQVLLRDDLKVRERYGYIHFLESMKKDVGKILTITHYTRDDSGKYYHFKESAIDFGYSEEMVKGLANEITTNEGEKKMTKFKVGETVTVRADLDIDGDYIGELGVGSMNVADEMVDLAGREVTIAQSLTYGHGETMYLIEEDSHGYYWSSTMFEEGIEKVHPFAPTVVEPVKPKAETIQLRYNGGMTIKLNRVIYNNPVTILFYEDEDGNERKIVTKAKDGDEYDRERGLEVAVLKATLKTAKRMLKTY